MYFLPKLDIYLFSKLILDNYLQFLCRLKFLTNKAQGYYRENNMQLDKRKKKNNNNLASILDLRFENRHLIFTILQYI